MVKNSFLLVTHFFFIFLASGCVTICAEKVYVDGNSSLCIKKAAKAGTEKDPNIVERADDWVKKNLW